MRIGFLAMLFLPVLLAGQGSTGAYRAVGTMSDIMLGMVYPAMNDILLHVHRGGPANEGEWRAIEQSAVLLAESGNLLAMRNPNSAEWVASSAAMIDVGDSAYRAASARDRSALAALSGKLDASCTSCHTRFRPDVHPGN